jgi:hypothetical protein
VPDRADGGSESCSPQVVARGHSSAGRAPALQAGGRRFDPDWLHQEIHVGWAKRSVPTVREVRHKHCYCYRQCLCLAFLSEEFVFVITDAKSSLTM